MRQQRPLPFKYRRWLLLFAMTCAGLSTVGFVVLGNYAGAIFTLLTGVFAWLTLLGYATSPRLAAWLLYRIVVGVLVIWALYRILFTSASPT